MSCTIKHISNNNYIKLKIVNAVHTKAFMRKQTYSQEIMKWTTYKTVLPIMLFTLLRKDQTTVIAILHIYLPCWMMSICQGLPLVPANRRMLIHMWDHQVPSINVASYMYFFIIFHLMLHHNNKQRWGTLDLSVLYVWEAISICTINTWPMKKIEKDKYFCLIHMITKCIMTNNTLWS